MKQEDIQLKLDGLKIDFANLAEDYKNMKEKCIRLRSKLEEAGVYFTDENFELF